METDVYSVEEFTGLRRRPPAATLAMQYPYLSNAPISDTYYDATEIQNLGHSGIDAAAGGVRRRPVNSSSWHGNQPFRI